MNKGFRLIVLMVFLLPVPLLMAQEKITLADGSSLAVFMVMPEDPAAEALPLAIVMGGGPGDMSISADTSRWLGSGFAARGWAVAVPVSPDRRSFRSSVNAEKIELLINELQQRPEIQTGKTLLAGVSNGGMSALGIASRNPQNYLGVAAVPALAADVSSLKALNGFPVYLRIGGNDQLGWADQFDATVARMQEAGVQLDAAIIDGAPHMFQMDWESLSAWLDSIAED